MERGGAVVRRKEGRKDPKTKPRREKEKGAERIKKARTRDVE